MADNDFRVKNGIVANTNLIYAPGGGGKVGINTSSLDATLSVGGSANVRGNLSVTGTLTSTGNVVSNSFYGSLIASNFGNDNAGQVRLVVSNTYGVILRNDATSMWFLQTAANDVYGTFNGYRPISWNFATGDVHLNGENTSNTYCGGSVYVNSQVLANSTISVTTGNFNAYVNIFANTNYQSVVNFGTATLNKWTIGKQTDDTFILYDTAASTFRITANSSGSMVFNANTVFNGTPVFNSGYASLNSSAFETGFRLTNSSTNGRDYWLISGGSGGSFTNGCFGIFDNTSALVRLSIAANGQVYIPYQLSVGSLNNNITGFTSFSNNSSGIIGQSNSATGVYGLSSGGYGVQGVSPTSVGVFGSSLSWIGVYGISNSNIGVQGISNSNVGVWGISNNGIGGFFQSNSSYGLVGKSLFGGVGVQGNSNTAWGGVFQSNTGVALLAQSNTNGTIFEIDNANGAITYFTADGNIHLNANNPSIISGGSYIQINNGLYVSGGNNYFANLTSFRGGITNDTGTLTLSSSTTNTVVTSNLVSYGQISSSNGFMTSSYQPVSTQGAYLHWNRTGDGGTWLVNQKGAGTGGFYFGESNTTNGFTQSAYIGLTLSQFTGRVNAGSASWGDIGFAGYSNNSSGVYGQSNSSNGVLGNSTNGTGVRGISVSSTGVTGVSNSGGGAYFVSNTGMGALIQSNTGTIAQFANATSTIASITSNGINSQYLNVANNGAINFQNGVQIYEDTSGNGPGDCVVKTTNGTSNYYSTFSNTGNLTLPNSLYTGGGATISGPASIGTTSTIRGLNLGGEFSFVGTSTYKYINLSDDSGGNGSSYNLTIRGLASGGVTDVPLSSVSIHASTTSVSGNFNAGGNITAYSDESLKTDVEQITDALSKVKKLVGVEYTRISSGERDIGLIAQHVEKVEPLLIVRPEPTDEDPNPLLSVKYMNFVALLIEAIKDIDERLEKIEKR